MSGDKRDGPGTAATLRVLRVFSDAEGAHGNPLGVFLSGAGIGRDIRQAVAADLGFSETVFVDDPGRGEMRIFTPVRELPFAGHPSVGTAWALAQEGWEVMALRQPAGELTVRREGALTWIAARPEWAPDFEFVQLDSAAAVEALERAEPGRGDVYCWAWEDEAAGRLRSRGFFPGFGIAEDEATGSAAVALCARLSRPLEVSA